MKLTVNFKKPVIGKGNILYSVIVLNEDVEYNEVEYYLANNEDELRETIKNEYFDNDDDQTPKEILNQMFEDYYDAWLIIKEEGTVECAHENTYVAVRHESGPSLRKCRDCGRSV